MVLGYRVNLTSYTQAATPIKPLEAEFCRAAETEDRPRLCPADVPRLSTTRNRVEVLGFSEK